MEKVLYILERLYRMIEIPARYMDKTGEIVLFSIGCNSKNDPLISDDNFKKSIIAKLITDSAPILTFEEEIVYGAYKDLSECIIILGPIAVKNISQLQLIRYKQKHGIDSEEFSISLSSLDKLCSALCYICFALSGKYTIEADILLNNNENNGMEQKSAYHSYLIEKSDLNKQRFNFAVERQFVQQIREGDTEGIQKIFSGMLFSSMDESHVGKLSQNLLKQNEYIAATVIVLSSRAAIDGGLDSMTAYLLSDLYFQRLEKCKNFSEIYKVIQDVVLDYAKRVKDKKESNLHLSYIEQCKNYIAKNLTKNFTLEDIAKEINVNKSYLSRKFSEKVGMGIHKYAQKKRIEAAANMLKYSDQTIAFISNYLCFPSQSHFGKVFKEYMKLTPKAYRHKNKPIDF
ncbi:MAG: AraC family transcriptional regulator [Oscillospiraceae bacterium]|nr:AraC family transcriptional regulator [Oscillospiraceae bacterium]